MMQWSEGVIARAISRQTLARKCVVLVDNCNWTGHECDVLGVTTDLRIIDIEVKISRADLKADARKDKWWHRFGAVYGGVGPDGRTLWKTPDPAARPWPPKVWKHYYALPKDIWTPELLDCLPSKNSGVLLLAPGQNPDVMPVVVSVARRCTPNKDATKLQPQHVMDIARLANLRMWNAYEQLDSERLELQRIRALKHEVSVDVAN